MNAAEFGARGDGATDDTAALQKALDTGRSVRLATGQFLISKTLRLKADSQQLLGAGPEETIIKARGDFSECLRADRLAGIAIRDLAVNADREGRRGTQSTRTLGIFLVSCRDARVENCLVANTVGGAASAGGKVMSGVGIAIGYGRRCLVADCLVDDCGTLTEGEHSDGIYTSGEFNVIRDCKARKCTDTAFVIEDSDYSGVVRCRAEACSAGLGITCARETPARGNYADDLRIHDWNGAVTGGISIGCPVATRKGNLEDTSLLNVEIERVDGKGPAINVRRTGPARIVGLLLRNVHVKGAGTQGILLDSEDTEVLNCSVADTEWTAIQIQPTCRDIEIRKCTVTNPKGFGISILGPASDILVLNNEIKGEATRMTWGLYTFDVAERLVLQGNAVTGAQNGTVGQGQRTTKATKRAPRPAKGR